MAETNSVSVAYNDTHFPDKVKDEEVSGADMANIAKALNSLVNHTHTYTDTYDTNCNCNCNCSRGIL